jgi:hypothetical protein
MVMLATLTRAIRVRFSYPLLFQCVGRDDVIYEATRIDDCECD